jgi:hypothetical protein
MCSIGHNFSLIINAFISYNIFCLVCYMNVEQDMQEFFLQPTIFKLTLERVCNAIAHRRVHNFFSLHTFAPTIYANVYITRHYIIIARCAKPENTVFV